MALVFLRRLAVSLWAIMIFTVAPSAPSPTTLFLIPSSTLVVTALLGIAPIIFTTQGVVPWLRTSRAIARSAAPRRAHKMSAAVTLAAGTSVRALDEPNASTADDVLDLSRMDDDGGWQTARPPV